jgi:hypothetical protein
MGFNSAFKGLNKSVICCIKTIRTAVKGICKLRDIEVERTNSRMEETEMGRILNLREWKEKCVWRSKAVT